MDSAAQPKIACAQCAATLQPLALSCPECKTLVYAEQLEELAGQARAASSAGDLAGSLRAWEQALALLPADTVQYRTVQDRIAVLEEGVASRQAADDHSRQRNKWIARLGPLGIIIWKFKTIALLLVTKGKLLLLGFTKLPTLLSMFASFGVYWSIYGWKFALGLILSIYVHEMGHVAALKRFGIPATAPMFIPGFGALVMLKQHPPTRAQDARVGLAGPFWGLGAALFAFVVFQLTGEPVWGAIAKFGAIINLFNMIPVWQLDGSRGFSALTRAERGLMLGVVAVTWFLTGTGMLFLVGLGCTFRLFTKDAPQTPDRSVQLQYASLIVLLGILSQINIPMQI
jgi:Zn-dependent protease